MVTSQPGPSISDLAPLLYQARWLRSSLSGEVRSRRWHPDSDEERSGTLLAAPGGRYQADLADEDGDRELIVCDDESGTVPFPELLVPSWLLAQYDLEVTGETEHLPTRPLGHLVWPTGPRRASPVAM